ncbi:hypothetical protein LNO89_28210 [Klebsiella pneumoniae subsp. pneumoniae]|nr:hypothetical protein [Klebsiella pneumoniae subsp. pneumoniae]
MTAKALAALEQGGDAQEIMQDLARKLTNRLIHAPTKSLQQAARDGDDERLHILRNSPRAGIAHLSLIFQDRVNSRL